MTHFELLKEMQILINNNFLSDSLHIDRESVEIFFIPMQFKNDIIKSVVESAMFFVDPNIGELDKCNNFLLGGKRAIFVPGIEKLTLFIGDLIT